MHLFSVILFGTSTSNPLNAAFGWLTKILYDFFGSYGWAIIFVTVIIRGLMIPLNVRSQKSMSKQQALGAQQAEIKRKYPDDKQKQQEEISKLYAANGAKSFGGCVLPILSMVFILPIYSIVRAPYAFLTGLSEVNLGHIGQLLLGKGLIAEGVANAAANNPIPVMDALQNNASALQEAVSEGFLNLGQLIDMNFLGFDLSLVPSWDPSVLFGAESHIYLPLLIIPFLVVATNIIQIRLTTIMRPNYKADKEARARAKQNPARAEQVPPAGTEGMMKMMNWLMPVMSLVFTFTMPSAMGFYWIVGGILTIAQQVITYYLYTKPLEERKKEMREVKQLAFTKGINTAEQIAEERFGKKKKKTAQAPVVEEETKKSGGYERQKRKK